MSATLNRILPNANSRSIIVTLIALLIVAASSYWLARRPSKEVLIWRLNSQLREGQFEQLYDEAAERLRSNVTKGKFIQRMKTAVAKLKAIDPDLNFQRDREWERSINPSGDESFLISAYQRLRKGDEFLLVNFNWDTEGEFFELVVFPSAETLEEYRVHGVGYQHLYIGGKMVE